MHSIVHFIKSNPFSKKQPYYETTNFMAIVSIILISVVLRDTTLYQANRLFYYLDIFACGVLVAIAIKFIVFKCCKSNLK